MATNYDVFDYPAYWERRKYENQAEKIALKRLLGKITSKNSLVDIGGGFGRLADVYAPTFKTCLLFDSSEKLLKIAQGRLKEYQNLKTKKGQAQNLPLANEKWDVVLMIRVIHHLPDLAKPLHEAYRVLKPQGYLILEFPNKIHLKSIIKAISKRKIGYLLSHIPEDISSDQKISFNNYHPVHIKSLLLAHDFKIRETLSVSNFRNPLFKKIIPLKILLFLETLVQPLLAHFNFGPSIFILAQKT